MSNTSPDEAFYLTLSRAVLPLLGATLQISSHYNYTNRNTGMGAKPSCNSENIA